MRSNEKNEVKLKKQKVIFIILLALIALLIIGGIILHNHDRLSLSNKSANELTKSTDALTKSVDEQNAELDKKSLTSLQAAELAYKKAKEWKDDAILRYMTAVGSVSDSGWKETDRTREWGVGFVSKKAKLTYLVTITGDKITEAVEEKNDKIEMGFTDSYPADRPVRSMKDASKVIIENGFPSSTAPMTEYYIEQRDMPYKGKAVWVYGFAYVKKADQTKSENNAPVKDSCNFVVDGETGKLLKIMDGSGKPMKVPSQN